jgi:hypothetical protein
MEKKKVKNENYLVKTILFVLVLSLSCLLFFGLGNAEKTTHELISFGILALSEFLVFISIIICNVKKDKTLDLVFASILYAVASTFLNFVIKLSVTKDLIVWNAAIFIVYLFFVVILVSSRKK